MSRGAKKRQHRAKRKFAAYLATVDDVRFPQEIEVKPVVNKRCEIDPSLRWFIIRSGFLSERRVAEDIGRLGLATFVPVYVEERRKGGRKTSRMRVLFPRYLFVGLDMDRPRYDLVNDNGRFDRFLRFEDKPISVTAPVLQEISDRITGHHPDPYEFSKAPQPLAFVVGDQVKVRAGPFASFSAVVEAILADGGIIAGVNIFGRSSPTTFEMADLEHV